MSNYQKISNVYDQLLVKGKTGIINQDFSDLVVEGGILAKEVLCLVKLIEIIKIKNY